jgi:hypothetical protein
MAERHGWSTAVRPMRVVSLAKLVKVVTRSFRGKRCRISESIVRSQKNHDVNALNRAVESGTDAYY